MPDRKLIVFDFDGTLVDSIGAFKTTVQNFCAENHLPCDLEKMVAGYIDPEKYDLGWGVTLSEQPAIFQRYMDYYVAEMEQNPVFAPALYDGAAEVVAELAQIYDLAILTARDRRTLDVILKMIGLDKYFPMRRTLCCVKERGYSLKPHPDALHCLLRETGHEMKDIVIVGDSLADIDLANAADVRSIAALWGGYPVDKLTAAKPTVMLENIRDLPEVLVDIFNLQ